MITIQQAWCRETSSDPEKWTPENPALGQCAVTALVIQDLLGGILVRAKVNGVSHYWNSLPNGDKIDMTLRQFGDKITFDELPDERSREYVTSFPETVRRYELLKKRVYEPV